MPTSDRVDTATPDDTVRAALVAGEQSGEPEAFDFDRFLAAKKA
jgi:antitoxin ParD1/3/4